MREHEPEHVAAYGAERHAHTDLAAALRHRVGHQSVDGGPAATRVYDRYTYDLEKRAALERWSSRLTAIVEKKA